MSNNIEIINTRFMEHIFFDNDIAGAQTTYLYNGDKEYLITYMTREIYDDLGTSETKQWFDEYLMDEIKRRKREER